LNFFSLAGSKCSVMCSVIIMVLKVQPEKTPISMFLKFGVYVIDR